MEKTHNLSEGNIFKGLIMFSIPVILALLLQAMYSAVDMVVVGRFAKTVDVSAVATGGMIMQVVTHVITGLAMGITVMVGQKIGENKPDEAGKVIGSGICLFVVFAAMLTAFMAIGSKMLAGIMHAPEEAMKQTTQYILICGIGSLFIVAYNLLGSIFRGLGDSKTPLVAVAIACVLNIFGDLLFVAVFNMGAAGAALATVIAQAFSVFLSFIMIKRKQLPFSFNRSYLRFDKELIGKELKLGIPVALQEFLTGFSLLILQTIVNGIGVDSSAAVGVGEKVCVFIMLIPMAFIQSMSAFVAQNIGAKRPDRANKALGCGILISIIVGVVTGYLSFFHGDLLAKIFDNDISVITNAHDYLKAYGIDCLLTPIVFCFLGYYNGYGKTLFVMLQSLCTAFLVKIPDMNFVSKTTSSLFKIGLGIPTSSAVQIVICLVMFAIMEKKRKVTL